jgi:hypothetical protein
MSSRVGKVGCRDDGNSSCPWKKEEIGSNLSLKNRNVFVARQ